jgi:hypothetical protein
MLNPCIADPIAARTRPRGVDRDKGTRRCGEDSPPQVADRHTAGEMRRAH